MDKGLEELLSGYKKEDIVQFLQQREIKNRIPNIEKQIEILENILPSVKEIESYSYDDRNPEVQLVNFIGNYINQLYEDKYFADKQITE